LPVYFIATAGAIDEFSIVIGLVFFPDYRNHPDVGVWSAVFLEGFPHGSRHWFFELTKC
jgi:hypothetical protein